MKKRYIIYLCVLLLAIVGGVSVGGSVIGVVPPVLPVIQLPGEVLWEWPGGSDFLGGWFSRGFTNTFLATLITFVIILAIAFSLRARSRTADEVPTGFYNFFEMFIEFTYGYVENSAGKWAKTFFPFFMTFILWIVIANWMELVPTVDSVGLWENIPHFEAEKALVAAEEAIEEGATPFEALNAAPLSAEVRAEVAEAFEIGPETTLGEAELDEFLHALEEEVEHTVDEENVGNLRRGVALLKARSDPKPEDADWTIIPFVRAAATDLNFTLSLAIISVVMTQYYGMRAQGLKYWTKFFTWPAQRIAENPLAILDPVVGLLEFISEVFKIVSFAFRLLGNIFAGQILLFVVGALLPLGNLLFWHLEFAIGALQALVFALLTLTFMSGATQSHGHDH